MLIDDEAKALKALANFHNHLEPDGRLLVDIFLQSDFVEGRSTIGRLRIHKATLSRCK